MATIIANRKSSVIENLHVVMGFIRAVCPADNVLSREQGKFLAGMVNEAIEEIEANKKRIAHLEEYKAGWMSTLNVINKALHTTKGFGEHDFIAVAEFIKSPFFPLSKHIDNAIDGSFGIFDGCGRLLFGYDPAKYEVPVKPAVDGNKRQAIAIQAMHALIIAGLNTGAWEDYEDLVRSAYGIADEFLEGSQGGAV